MSHKELPASAEWCCWDLNEGVTLVEYTNSARADVYVGLIVDFRSYRISSLNKITLWFCWICLPAMFPRITRCLYCVQWKARNAFQKRTHNATLSVGGSSQWCAFNNAALCKRTASCICPRSLNAACFSGPLNSNSELLQVVNMVIAVFVTHWILNEDLDKTLC